MPSSDAAPTSASPQFSIVFDAAGVLHEERPCLCTVVTTNCMGAPEEQTRHHCHRNRGAPQKALPVLHWWAVDLQRQPRLPGGATRLVARCMDSFGWEESHARCVLVGYEQFLKLKLSHQDWIGSLLEPSRDVDHMWQQHTSDMSNYEDDCLLLVGQFLSRLPRHPDDDEHDLLRRRQNTVNGLLSLGEEIDHVVWSDLLDAVHPWACVTPSTTADDLFLFFLPLMGAKAKLHAPAWTGMPQLPFCNQMLVSPLPSSLSRMFIVPQCSCQQQTTTAGAQ